MCVPVFLSSCAIRNLKIAVEAQARVKPCLLRHHRHVGPHNPITNQSELFVANTPLN